MSYVILMLVLPTTNSVLLVGCFVTVNSMHSVVSANAGLDHLYPSVETRSAVFLKGFPFSSKNTVIS